MVFRAPQFRCRFVSLGLLIAAVACGPAEAALTGGAQTAPPTALFTADWHRLAALEPTANKSVFVIVDVARQQLYLFEHGRLAATWPVSTARRGTGEAAGSYQTPLGAFLIARKLGAGLGEFATLDRFGPTGGDATPVFSSHDPAAAGFITTRILMLEGIEPGWNEGGDVDTLARHIYIHGTADLGQLGEPASEGCVQMAPGAMIRLFRAVRPGTLVLITQGTGDLQEIPGETLAQLPGPSG